MENPRVSIILTSYNHEDYIERTLGSILEQTYTNIQLIVIDNASLDKTCQKIEAFLPLIPNATFIKNKVNEGLCKAFNQGLGLCNGKYVIDLSADDILLQDRIEKQVKAFNELGDDFAVVFSNAQYIDRNDKKLEYHYPVNKEGEALDKVPSGDIYKEVLKNYFICTPTMMMRTSILREIGGYDESLSFEDFDFWVRTSVKYKYFYLDQVLTNKRIVPNSLGSFVINKGNKILQSCYAVCNKAYDLNRDQQEFDLLADRIRTFIRKCWYAEEFDLAHKFRKLLSYIEDPDWLTEFVVVLCRLQIRVNPVYVWYIKNVRN